MLCIGPSELLFILFLNALFFVVLPAFVIFLIVKAVNRKNPLNLP
jgi:hypothetical protein